MIKLNFLEWCDALIRLTKYMFAGTELDELILRKKLWYILDDILASEGELRRNFEIKVKNPFPEEDSDDIEVPVETPQEE